MDVVRDTYRAATSRQAQRTLLGTVLLVSTSVLLFGLAAVSYVLFYHNYLPDQVTTVPVHLQYGYGINPYGIASLAARNLKDQQDYDVTVTLSLPRSPTNLDRGNFMLALHLLGGPAPRPGHPDDGLGGGSTPPALPDPHGHFQGRSVVYAAARPALIPYADPWVSAASRLVFILYHLLFPESGERAELAVPLAEGVRFRSAADVPTSLYLEVQAGQTLQVYRAAVTLTARLHGLRWLMYRHRVLAFVVLTTAFWLCEVVFAVLAWWFFASLLAGRDQPAGTVVGAEKTSKTIKAEGEDDLSDTPRTFPTHGRQPPLRYDPPRIKTEEGGGASPAPAEMLPAVGAEADDEDEDDVGGDGAWRDSGVGTSYSEGRRRGGERQASVVVDGPS